MTAGLQAAAIRKLHRAGVAKAEIARRLQIGRTSVRRIWPALLLAEIGRAFGVSPKPAGSISADDANCKGRRYVLPWSMKPELAWLPRLGSMSLPGIFELTSFRLK
jgi:hypothetical protein